MSGSDAIGVWGIVLSGVGLLVTGVGFWIAIVQLRRTATAAEATRSAVEATGKRMLYNHLLVLLPQMRTLEADLDAAMAVPDRIAAVRALVSFSHAANQVAVLLETDPQNHADLVAQLRTTARAASIAKAELVSNNKRSLATVLLNVASEISDVSSKCAGLSSSYQAMVA